MASTFLSLHAHIVFSTKNREHWFTDRSIRSEMHAVLGGLLKGEGCVPLEVGGVSDHVHLLMGFRGTHCIADVVRECKKGSTRWFRETTRRTAFAWQEGYGAFTVSPTGIAGVRKYIQNQEEHHQVKTFREEYLEMLHQAGIEPDMRFFD
ncbi:MAG: IS200/IS605 family transposase [Verrucomicrobia bacterium]|nr:IS200/IS605 family transposase [Verrucomicrobiota bacterium]MCH8511325.1 IS200/IS605 family transposase [Kiritimatiellia bacterium]